MPFLFPPFTACTTGTDISFIVVRHSFLAPNTCSSDLSPILPALCYLGREDFDCDTRVRMWFLTMQVTPVS